MSAENQEPPLWRSLAAEIFGTFALVFVDAGGAIIEGLGPAGEVTAVGRSFATGLLIMAIIYSLGEASGAHVNPAVTIGFALRRVFPWRRVPAYVLAQFGAAIAAALLLRALFGSIVELGVTEPRHGTPAGLVMEIVLTTLLATVILSTATRHRVLGPNAALAVGGTIALCGLFSRPISGASMNPARSFGPALVSGRMEDLWIYLIGPVVGVVIAVLFVRLVHGVPKPEEEKAAEGEDKEKIDRHQGRNAHGGSDRQSKGAALGVRPGLRSRHPDETVTR